jgi:hypothetical protein
MDTLSRRQWHVLLQQQQQQQQQQQHHQGHQVSQINQNHAVASSSSSSSVSTNGPTFQPRQQSLKMMKDHHRSKSDAPTQLPLPHNHHPIQHQHQHHHQDQPPHHGPAADLPRPHFFQSNYHEPQKQQTTTIKVPSKENLKKDWDALLNSDFTQKITLSRDPSRETVDDGITAAAVIHAVPNKVPTPMPSIAPMSTPTPVPVPISTLNRHQQKQQQQQQTRQQTSQPYHHSTTNAPLPTVDSSRTETTVPQRSNPKVAPPGAAIDIVAAPASIEDHLRYSTLLKAHNTNGGVGMPPPPSGFLWDDTSTLSSASNVRDSASSGSVVTYSPPPPPPVIQPPASSTQASKNNHNKPLIKEPFSTTIVRESLLFDPLGLSTPISALPKSFPSVQASGYAASSAAAAAAGSGGVRMSTAETTLMSLMMGSLPRTFTVTSDSSNLTSATEDPGHHRFSMISPESGSHRGSGLNLENIGANVDKTIVEVDENATLGRRYKTLDR